MTKTLTALAVAATVAVAAVAQPAPAEARSRGGAVAAGIIGGLAVGALLGSQARGGHVHYYEPAPRYYYRSRCHWERERYWNGYRWRSHSVRVCY